MICATVSSAPARFRSHTDTGSPILSKLYCNAAANPASAASHDGHSYR